MKAALKLTFFLGVIITVFSLYTCQKDEMVLREYPRINTLDVTDIDSTGALFTAEITQKCKDGIIDHGFIWGQYLADLPFVENVSLGPLGDGEKFQARIESALATNKPYKVKAYIKTSKFTVYGKEMEFLSLGSRAPKIINFWPDSARTGDTIYMKCTNLSKINNEIIIANKKNYTRFKNDSIIYCTIPEVDTIIARVGVTLSGNTTYAAKELKMITPKVTSITPLVAIWGDLITVKGKDFSRFGYNRITFNKTVIPAVSSSDSVITFKVPNNLNQVNSEIEIGPFKNPKFKFQIAPPEITSINDTSFKTPVQVYCSVKNIKKEIAKFYFNGVQKDLYWADNNNFSFYLKEMKNGKYPVYIEVLGQKSEIKSIEVSNPEVYGNETIYVHSGDTVTLTGKNLNTVNNVSPGYVISKSADKIQIKLPNDLAYNYDYRLVFDYNYTQNIIFRIKDAQITEIKPSSIKGCGDTIIINGVNFQSNVYLSLNNVIQLYPFSSSKTTLKFRVIKLARSDVNSLELHFNGLTLKCPLSEWGISLASPWKLKSKSFFMHNYRGFGGFNLNNNGYILQNIYTSYLKEYKVQTETWTDKNISIPEKFGNCGMFSDDNRGYVFSMNNRYLSIYNPEQNIFTEVQSPPGLTGHYVNGATNNGIVYFVCNNYLDYQKYGFYAYDQTTNTWEIKSPFPDFFDKASLLNLSGNLYSFNGSALKKYDCITNVWTRISTPYSSAGASSRISFQFNGKGYFIASNTDGQPRIFIYDPVQNTWQIKSCIPETLYDYFFINNKLYVSGESYNFYEYDPTLEP